MTRRHLLSAILVGQSWDRQLGGIAATVLAQWITASRQQALAAGTEPVPSDIMKSLAGYLPAELTRMARWRVGGTTSIPTLPGFAFQYGDVAAITLIDVVLFGSEGDARRNAKLWAHELTHVAQYQRWGVDGFATRYIADSGAVEREAYVNADRFAASRSRSAR